MNRDLLKKLDLKLDDPKFKRIEAFFIIREALNRFDYGAMIGIDYGSAQGPGVSEYDDEALALLLAIESAQANVKPLTKEDLDIEVLRIHRHWFRRDLDPQVSSLITEHVFNELYKAGLFNLCAESVLFNYYYKRRNMAGWPKLRGLP